MPRAKLRGARVTIQDDECEAHTSSAASLVIIGDAFHTFVDGAIIDGGAVVEGDELAARPGCAR